MPGAKLDPYAVLGVDRSASTAEIRTAYRALVARYHPDRHQGNPLEDLASERMAEINQAYAVLSDPAQRAAFDGGRSGAAGVAAARARDRGDGLGGAVRGGAAPRSGMNPIAKWALVILAFPLLIRSGAGLLRAIAGLGRGLFGMLGGFRGTPAGVALALAVAAALLVLALVRRRRRPR